MLSSKDTLQSLLKKELAPDEKLVWSLVPDPKKATTTLPPLGKFVFGSLFSSMPLYSLYKALEKNNFHVFQGEMVELFSLGFFGLIGILIAISPLFNLNQKPIKIYGITSTRALVLINVNNKASILSPFSLHDLKYTKMRKPDGGGDLIFLTTTSRDFDGRSTTQEVGFIGLDSVDEVEKILIKCMKH